MTETEFTKIYNDNLDKLLYYSINLLDSRVMAEDICADVFIKLWKSDLKLSTVKDIKSFLFISVRNACLNYLNSPQTKIEKKKIPIEYIEQIKTWEDISDVKFEYKQLLKQQIDLLPEQCKRICILAYYSGKKNKEIADILHIKEKTVKNHKLHLIQQLRKMNYR